MSPKLIFAVLLALGVFATSSIVMISLTTPTYAGESTGNDNT
jgi:hypothetical protein